MIHPRTLQSLEYAKVIAHLASFCITAPGKRLALATAPLDNVEQANEAFALYEEAGVWQAYPSRPAFTGTAFTDLEPLLKILNPASEKQGRLLPDIDALWMIGEMLDLAHKAYEAINLPQAAQLWPRLLAIATAAPFPSQTLAALRRCVSPDGIIKDESSPELFQIRSRIRSLHQSCLAKAKTFAKQYNMQDYLQDDFLTLASDRYVFPLKANFKGKMQGVIHDWSQTGETCYFEPIFLVEINNRLRELKHEELEEERKIIRYLVDLASAEYEGIAACHALLGRLDFLEAARKHASELDAHCVAFTPDEQGIGLIGARHPILAMQRKTGGQEIAKPLDITLRQGERVLIITGGNAGGKTVCLKTLGLISALAMSGLPVPCARGSHLPWFDRLDAFIGDEQSLDDNVSTFTAQIEHLSKAWKYLDNHGLVLLDEFGAGTDPAEGSALAQAVLDELLEKKCFVLAATHFPALKTYALSQTGCRAASMLFDPASGRPLFKIAYDQVGASHALEVAAACGLPESILSRARHYLLQEGADSSALLAKLNALASAREDEIANLRREREKADNSLKEKKEKLEKERARLAEELRARIAELTRAWKEDRATAKQTLKAMSGLRAELGLKDVDNSSSPLPPVEAFATGQTVFHAGFNKRGKITDIDQKRGKARLDMNGVSLWAEFKDLRQPGQEKQPRSTSGVKTVSSPASLSLDVRGMRAEEALAAVERFLDKAVPAGFSEVEIIHGRGTGALRREIHEFLRSFPPVANVALAPEDRGGDGMTIVALN